MIGQPHKDQFRQQYSKIGNAREQLFYAWRSFYYDENVEMIDAYVNRIRQVTALLGYGEPQILAVFKNTIPNKLYWILYAINNLRVAAETAKIVLTNERIDRQRMGPIIYKSIYEGKSRKQKELWKGSNFQCTRDYRMK